MLGFYSYTVILTYISLASSMVGIFCSFSGRFYLAAILLLFSGICDMFDGKIARTKKDRTEDEKRFGIQIDSLCDLVCFSVLPSVIAYSIGIRKWKVIILVLYTLAGVIRLAYFNVVEEIRQSETDDKREYYNGLPVTVSAFLFPLLMLINYIKPYNLNLVYFIFLIITLVLQVSKVRFKKPIK